MHQIDKRRFTFTLGQALFAITVISIGLAIGAWSVGGWTDSLLWMLAGWLVIALAKEARSFWLARSQLPSAASNAWLPWPVFWRAGTCLLLVVSFATQNVDVGEIATPFDDYELKWMQSRAHGALRCFGFLVALIAWPRPPRDEASQVITTVRNVVVWFGAIVLSAYVCIENAITPMLVHCAMVGIENAMSDLSASQDSQLVPYMDFRKVFHRFWQSSVATVGLIPINVVLLNVFARRRWSFPGGYMLSLGLLFAGVTFQLWMFAVHQWPSFSRACPAIANQMHPVPFVYIRPVAVLVLLATFIKARQLAAERGSQPVRLELNSTAKPHFVFLGALAIVSGSITTVSFLDVFESTGFISISFFSRVVGSTRAFFGYGGEPPLLVAILGLACQRLYWIYRGFPHLETIPPRVPNLHSLLVWLALILILLAAVPTLYLFGMAYWLRPSSATHN